MKRLCSGDGYGGGAGRSISDLPQELLECILWRIKKGREAAACGMVCKLWEKIIRECPALELEFKVGPKMERSIVRVPRTEAIIGSMLMQRPRLRELSIVFEQILPLKRYSLREDRIVKWYLPLASGVETLRIGIPGLNLLQCLTMPRLKKLLVSGSALRKMPRSLPTDAGKNLRYCSLDLVVFSNPLSKLLSACPSLESLTLNKCRSTWCPGTEISSRSLRRIYIVNDKWEWISVDAPRVDLLAIKSYTLNSPVISASKYTWVKCLFLMSPIQLTFGVNSVILFGDEWKSLHVVPGRPSVPVKAKPKPIGDAVNEEMTAWLEKSEFKLDVQNYKGHLRRILNDTDETRGLQASSSVSLQLF